VSQIVAQIRRRWPWTRILLRDDTGFAGEALMTWCEANRLDFLFELARNERLEAAIRTELTPANLDTGRAARTAVQDFMWSTPSPRHRQGRDHQWRVHSPVRCHLTEVPRGCGATSSRGDLPLPRRYCRLPESLRHVRPHQLSYPRLSALQWRAQFRRPTPIDGGTKM